MRDAATAERTADGHGPDTCGRLPEPVRARLAAHAGRADAPTCDLAVANLVVWRDCEVPAFLESHGCLCVRLTPQHGHGAPHHLEPVPLTPEADPLAAAAAEIDGGGCASRIGEALAHRLRDAGFHATPLRDHADYVYDRRDLAEMRGTRHDGHRNQIRKFEREHPRAAFRPLVASDGPAALGVFDAWCSQHAQSESDAPPGPAALADACQRGAIRHAFEAFDDLGLCGGAVVEDGRMTAFLLASASDATAFVHFLYADARRAGVYQWLLRTACRTVLDGRPFVDLEEDLGVPGLRRAKLAYGPLRLVAKYEVTRRRT